MNFKKNVLFLTFLSIFAFNTSVSPVSTTTKVVTGTVIGALTVSHIWGLIREYTFKSRLYRTGDDKHTWNFLEELFPSKHEMDNAEGDFPYLIQQNVKTFKSKYTTDPLYLIHFTKDMEDDLASLRSMKHSLKGNPSSPFPSVLEKKISNSTVFLFIRSRIDALYNELCRYENRLKKIMHTTTNSYEFQNQLQMLYAKGRVVDPLIVTQ